MKSEELINKYKELHKRKTGVELSDQDAYDQAMKLVTLVDAVYKPIPKKA